MLKSNIQEPNYLPELEVLDNVVKINGHEINGITHFDIKYQSDSKIVSVNISLTAKCVK